MFGLSNMYANLDKLSQQLVTCKYIPWRLRYQGGPLNTIIYRPFRQKMLLDKVRTIWNKPDGITIVIAIRNRVDYKIWNSLSSIRQQDYPQDLIKITIVDYGSSSSCLNLLKSYCEYFDAELIDTKINGKWRRSHCLNIGIKKANTKFLMSSDADILFNTNYLSQAISKLKKDPLTIIFSQCLDLGPDTVPILSGFKDGVGKVDVAALRKTAHPRSIGDCEAGINLSYTIFYHYLRGYDEFYSLWGSEDTDLKRRFEYMGAKSFSISKSSFYLHQWHEKFSGVLGEDHLQEKIKENNHYFEKDHAIKKNDDKWGEY